MEKTKEIIKEDIESEELLKDATDILNQREIIVYNDNINSFNYVINVFMKVFNHTNEQSNQLAIIIHHKGKASVKKGKHEDLVPYCHALNMLRLTAEIK